MWFCTLANVTKNCTLTRNVPQTHWFAIKRLLHNWSWHKPAKLKLQFQSYSIPMRLASTKKHTHTQTWQQGSGLVSNKPCYLHVGVQMWISLMFDFPQKKRWLEYLTSPHHPIFVRHIQIYNMPELPGNFANPFHSKGWRRIGFRPLLPRCEHVWGTQFTRLQQVTTANSRGLDCWLAKVLSSFIIKFHLSSFRSNISRRKLA